MTLPSNLNPERKTLGGLLYAAALATLAAAPTFADDNSQSDDATVADSRPNIVVIFIDDMGYADIGPFGATDYNTPNLDRMAAEGRVFTDFHSATAVCSASRAALLTGCYPERVSILGALFPGAKHGLHADEVTLAEICKRQGYATAAIGKWHLGDLEPFLPLAHGFDEYFGLPYSNDMWPDPAFPGDAGSAWRKRMPPLPLLAGTRDEGHRVADAHVTAKDQAELTRMYTEKAVDFIDRNHQRPFFLYLPHTMVHVPIFASEKFRGKSGAGDYGDVVMELDWSVGEVLDALKRQGIDEQTFVIFTSDNGPWLLYGNHAGSAGPLREGKATMFEGGHREPCIMRWPGKIAPGTRCDELATTMDLLPTIASWIDAELPEHKIDGKDITPLITGDGQAQSPHDVIYGYYNRELHTVRDRRWKLHLPHGYPVVAEAGEDGRRGRYRRAKIGHELYDLKNDVGETTDVSAEHPKVVARLESFAEQARRELGDKLTGQVGEGVRPHGVVESPK